MRDVCDAHERLNRGDMSDERGAHDELNGVDIHDVHKA
jgi:hypothetical protein